MTDDHCRGLTAAAVLGRFCFDDGCCLSGYAFAADQSPQPLTRAIIVALILVASSALLALER
jgi:hypothetical protein